MIKMLCYKNYRGYTITVIPLFEYHNMFTTFNP